MNLSPGSFQTPTAIYDAGTVLLSFDGYPLALAIIPRETSGPFYLTYRKALGQVGTMILKDIADDY